MAFNSGTAKPAMVHLYWERFFNDKQEHEPSSKRKTCLSLKYIQLSDRSYCKKGHVRYDSNYMIFWEGQSYRKSKWIEGYQGFRMVVNLINEAQDIFIRQELFLGYCNSRHRILWISQYS